MAEPATPAAASDWRDRADAYVTAGDEPCERHPGNKRFRCPDCRAELDEQALRERLEEVATDAGERCDRLFPRRYAGATEVRPEIANWVGKFNTDPDNSPSLLILGPTGTGKTYQAYAALRQAATHPRPTRGVGYRAIAWEAATYADILASMRPNPRNDSETELKRLRDVPLLVVDDLGVAKQSEWVEDVTYRLINGRYEDMRPSIFTSNLAVDQLREALGDRIASRLAETCTRVVLAGADRRRTPTRGATP